MGDDKKKQTLSQVKREELLIKWLNKYEDEGVKSNLSINYLYYDGWNETEEFEYDIDPYNIVQEYKCGDKLFYIKSQYEQYLKT